MEITYNSAVAESGGVYYISLGGRVYLSIDSTEQEFILSFDLKTSISSTWNAPFEVAGPSGINVQNQGYTSYYSLLVNSSSVSMPEYNTSYDDFVHYEVAQHDRNYMIRITVGDAVYENSGIASAATSGIYIGNWQQQERTTAILKNIKFDSSAHHFLDGNGLAVAWDITKTWANKYKQDKLTAGDNITITDNVISATAGAPTALTRDEVTAICNNIYGANND